MNDAIGRSDMDGLREDIRELTKAVLTVGTVLLSALNVYTGSADPVRARREVEYIHGRVDVR